ncbi:hypothetical protein D3C73_275170 [compost metagenome]
MLFLLRNFLTALIVIYRQINARFTRQMFKRLAKIHALYFHDKRKDISAAARREVVPNMLVRAHHETRCFFGAKWTKSLEVTPCSFEHHVFTNYVLNIELGADFFFSILHTHSIAPFTSVSVCA